MSKSIKSLALVGVLALVAACANTADDSAVEEFVVVDPEPISSEPSFTGKYK